MPTKNRRVATYLPKEIHERFESFKLEKGIKGDSQALLAILFEFLGVSQNVAYLVAQNASVGEEQISQLIDSHLIQLRSQIQDLEDQALRIEAFEDRLQSLEKWKARNDMRESSNSLLSSPNSELLNRIQALEARLADMEASQNKDATLSTGELAKRLGMDSSTLSHWKSGKKGKSPDELLKATRAKDPDGIGWILVPEINRFRPERDLPGSSSNVFQGELLSEIPSSQVNPLPEGSERSGEG